jgi:hypothetical protein
VLFGGSTLRLLFGGVDGGVEGGMLPSMGDNIGRIRYPRSNIYGRKSGSATDFETREMNAKICKTKIFRRTK